MIFLRFCEAWDCDRLLAVRTSVRLLADMSQANYAAVIHDSAVSFYGSAAK